MSTRSHDSRPRRRGATSSALQIEEVVLEYPRPEEKKSLSIRAFAKMPDEARDRLREDVLRAKRDKLGRAYGPNGKQIQKTLFEAIQ